MIDLRSAARALGGEISGGQIKCPGPNHSARDRSLSVRFSPTAPDGFIVTSHAGDDDLAAKDYVRSKLGLPEWQPSDGEGAYAPSPTRTVRRLVASYVYKLADGTPYLRVDRFEPKSAGFPQYRWTGSAWVPGKPQGPKIPYRLPEMLEAGHDTVFVVEGEKDADALAARGFVATTASEGAGKWTADLARYFSGRTVYVLADNDEAGTKHAVTVAESLKRTAREVRIVNLPGLPPKGDVFDWLRAENNPDGLEEICRTFPVYDGRPDAQLPRTITTITADELYGRPVPPRRSHVPGLIPARTVTLLSGDGGTGKSLLSLQLAAATALGSFWAGQGVEQGRVLYLSAEDELDELHRRLADIVRASDVKLSDLHELKLVPLAGEDAVLAAPGPRSNVIAATPLWHQIEAEVSEWRPALIVLDTLADLFAGEENQRAQARQFVGLLRGLAMRHDSTVLLLGHPSLSGISSGTGTSGSTGWSNSVRSRLYLKRVVIREEGGDIEPDPDARVLATMKSNYGPVGGEIRLRWDDGVFRLDQTEPSSLEQAARLMHAETVFLDLLADYLAEGRHVSSTPSANYAPTVFAKDPRSKGVGRVALQIAMNKLFGSGRIVMGSYGPPSKVRKHIVLNTRTEDEE